ncbi:hypothetical protein DL96DRAFT_177834 [Flagelloscypha sp. PMI_526]|nr:hypothetical protein DL96DRAFT_177834 [Flagelloscypha sp. PMI_526]
MATASYTIYSRNDPAKPAVVESGSDDPTLEPSQGPWTNEALQAFRAPTKPPPRFVPASSSAFLPEPPKDRSEGSQSSAAFYRALMSERSTPGPQPRLDSTPRPASTPVTSTSSQRSSDPWFIRSLAHAIPPKVTPAVTSSMDDILDRNPPPLPGEDPIQPRVWLAIGPSNKGFGLLSRQGWNEGEALGPGVSREHTSYPSSRNASPSRTVEVSYGSDDEVKELRSVEIVDLTNDSLSSGDETDDDDDLKIPPLPRRLAPDVDSDGRTALVVPLPIRLKSDKLGIGLKAKTTGPYNASKARITPTSAALRAHIQASENLRRQKKRHGRGQRGFARKNKLESTRRQDLMAYMNT